MTTGHFKGGGCVLATGKRDGCVMATGHFKGEGCVLATGKCKHELK